MCLIRALDPFLFLHAFATGQRARAPVGMTCWQPSAHILQSDAADPGDLAVELGGHSSMFLF